MLGLKLDLNQGGCKEAALDLNDEHCLGSDQGAWMESGSPGSGSCSSSQDMSDPPRWMATGWMGLLGFVFSFEKKLSSLNWKTFHIKKYFCSSCFPVSFLTVTFFWCWLVCLEGWRNLNLQVRLSLWAKKPNWWEFDGRTHCNTHFRVGGSNHGIYCAEAPSVRLFVQSQSIFTLQISPCTVSREQPCFGGMFFSCLGLLVC